MNFSGFVFCSLSSVLRIFPDFPAPHDGRPIAPPGARMPRLARRRLPYTWRSLAGDAAGGAIAALIALPYGLALATLMGLPPLYGLLTSILTAPITAALGRNPVLIGGTASATVPFIALAARSQGIGGVAKLCIAASIIMMGFCVLRLGRQIARVPHAVVSGFSCGIGAMMVILQLRTLLGLPKGIGGGSTPGLELLRVAALLPDARWGPMLLGTLVVAGALAAHHRFPRSPAPLLGVLLALAVGGLVGVHEGTVGRLRLELPSLVGFAWSPTDARDVLPSALGLAFVASVNVLITSRVVEHFRGRHRPLRPADADAELGAYGIANLCAGLFGAPVAVGIPARSLANLRCGGTSRLSNLLHAVFLVAFLGLGGPWIARVPVAALAGVTAYVGICLLEWSTWRRLPRMRRVDAAAFLLTAAAVLATNAVAAVALGCGVYVVRYGYTRWVPASTLHLVPAPGTTVEG